MIDQLVNVDFILLYLLILFTLVNASALSQKRLLHVKNSVNIFLCFTAASSATWLVINLPIILLRASCECRKSY